MSSSRIFAGNTKCHCSSTSAVPGRKFSSAPSDSAFFTVVSTFVALGKSVTAKIPKRPRVQSQKGYLIGPILAKFSKINNLL